MACLSTPHAPQIAHTLLSEVSTLRAVRSWEVRCGIDKGDEWLVRLTSRAVDDHITTTLSSGVHYVKIRCGDLIFGKIVG